MTRHYNNLFTVAISPYGTPGQSPLVKSKMTLLSLRALSVFNYSLFDDYMAIIWAYQFYLWSMCYLLIGMGAICLLLEAQNGMFAVLAVLFYPMYCLGVLTVWSEVGSYFEKIASGLNQALYDSDWINMPVSTRKWMILMMTFGQNTPIMKFRPFYVANRESFAGVWTDNDMYR